MGKVLLGFLQIILGATIIVVCVVSYLGYESFFAKGVNIGFTSLFFITSGSLLVRNGMIDLKNGMKND